VLPGGTIFRIDPARRGWVAIEQQRQIAQCQHAIRKGLRDTPMHQMDDFLIGYHSFWFWRKENQKGMDLLWKKLYFFEKLLFYNQDPHQKDPQK